MNILITYISKLPAKKPDEITYNTQKVGGSSAVKGILSVEPVVKLLASENAVDRIIALVSDEVKSSTNNYKNETAYDYFKSVVFEATRKDDILIPVYESADSSEKPLGAIISEICDHISPDDNIYIDTTGGPRKTTNLIQLLTKILRYKGINNPCSYYTSIQKSGIIETTEEFTELTTLADAVNEFVTGGLSDQLRKCMEKETRFCPSLSPLLDSMKAFTDNIRLCYVEQFDSVMDRLEKTLTDFDNEDQPYTETKAVILKQLTPVIREKFFKNGRDSCGNIPNIIEWCLDNGLVQQALTVFTEKVPVYLFKNGIFAFDDTVAERCKKKKISLDSIHSEVNVFYQDLMSRTKKDIEAELFGNIITEKLVMPENYPHRCKVKDIKRFTRRYDADLLNSKSFFKLKNLLRDQDTSVKNIANILISKKGKDGKTVNYSSESSALLSSVENDTELLYKLLGYDYSRNDNVFFKKFEVAEDYLTDSSFCPNGYSVNISNLQFAGIMYAYIYVKSQRNRINHASDNENLTAEQAAKLIEQGYEISGVISCDEIIKNLRHALDAVKAAVSVNNN